ncbi:MAG: transcription termination/antitermination protein NusA, partial [Elusimicrobia bacterium]|nr:transcription termination/antitermination protein NusA [Elusimicrobiota bacterium]
ALVSAYKKHSGKILNVEAIINPETAEVQAFVIKKVVEEVKNANFEISLAEARQVSPKVKLEEDLRIPIETEDFSRIAAQTAKQVIIQKIRETERESLYDEFKGKEGTLVSGSVHRFVDRNLIVDLGKTEGILPAREQVPRERFGIGERLRVLILKVERGTRGPKILVSRVHPLVVQRLFEQEVPEMYEKTVGIVEVVREPGFRSKVAVRSFNPKVDPVGACVGVKGSRVRPIIDELRGERIDLIAYSEDPAKYLAASLSPAKVLSVTILNEAEKQAEVLVGNDMLSLAIGKAGQNARLAAKLTGWHIDIKSDTQKKEEAKQRVAAAAEALSQLPGVGPKTVEVLLKGGWDRIEKIAQAHPQNLTVLQGIGPKTAAKLIQSAKTVLAERAAKAPAPKEEAK